MRIALYISGSLVVLMAGTGCSNWGTKGHNYTLVTEGGQVIKITGVRFHPADGEGGDAGGTVTIEGLSEGTGGRPVRVTITNDPGGDHTLSPNDPTWVGESNPAPNEERPYSSDPNNPVPQELTDPIPVSPGQSEIIIHVQVQRPDGTTRKDTIRINFKKPQHRD